MSHEEIFEEFKKWNPTVANMVIKWKPWGKTSLCIWLRNGMKYKAKFFGKNSFIMQMLSEEDIDKKFGENNE